MNTLTDNSDSHIHNTRNEENPHATQNQMAHPDISLKLLYVYRATNNPDRITSWIYSGATGRQLRVMWQQNMSYMLLIVFIIYVYKISRMLLDKNGY